MRPDRSRSRNADRDDAMFEWPSGRALGSAPSRQPITGLCHSFAPLRKQEAGQHGRDHNRENQRAQQGKRHRPGHRFEQTAFNALQREDRQIGGDDDGDRVETGRCTSCAASRIVLSRRGIASCAVKMANDVLHHHHGAINHHAEIERAQREQVGRNVAASPDKSTRRAEKRGSSAPR